jgi:hypothetical protein
MQESALIVYRKLLDQALKVFSGNSCYKPELARTMFKKSQLLEMVGRSDESIIACTEAISLRNSLVINERKGSDVGEEDFNSLVAFWSR